MHKMHLLVGVPLQPFSLPAGFSARSLQVSDINKKKKERKIENYKLFQKMHCAQNELDVMKRSLAYTAL